ncbi:Rtf2 RING-finger-domain-containing protein [Abortiporus biennis]|nr:Rtf2 RING-finger-domain-containing protein [Abortiporus biennis]
MGNDGGSIPDRRDLVRSKPKAEQADKANQVRARWFFCALSKKSLQEPIVSCALGKLYNKDAIIEFLLDRSAYGDGENICSHIRSLKDVKTLKLTHNTIKAPPSGDSNIEVAPFVCPLNFKEMNGVQPFVYLWPCGCVFSQAGLKAVSKTPPLKEETSKPTAGDKEKEKSASPSDELDLCPQCATKYNRSEDIVLLNPPLEEEEKMRAAMERKRAAEPTKKKGKKRKGQAEESSEPPAKKKHSSALPSMNSNIAAASRAVAQSLAEEEAKRKANMSDAVKSLYGPKDGSKRKETFMTMGTFTRYA